MTLFQTAVSEARRFGVVLSGHRQKANLARSSARERPPWMRSLAVVVLAGLSSAPLARAQVIYTVEGDAEKKTERFGDAIAALGDIDGDGFDDFLAGARRGGKGGQAFVFSGVDGSLLFELAGKNKKDNFGVSVASAGDVNNDGVLEFMIGADKEGENKRGKVRVYSGLNGKVILKFEGDQGDRLGCSVSAAGDADSDGFADVIIGARHDSPNGKASGTAKVYSGKDGDCIYDFLGESPNDLLGYLVAGAFDANGDGIDDFAASAIGSDETAEDAGSVRIYSGEDGSLLRILTGIAPHQSFGFRLSPVRDVDGDGADDLLIGDRGQDPVFSLVSGKTGISLRAHPSSSSSIGDVCPVGDVDQDGVHDYAVGDPSGDRVEVFSGATGESLFKYIDGSTHRMGFALAGPIDVNQDGLNDVLAGDPYFEEGNVRALSTGCGKAGYLGGACGGGLWLPTLTLVGQCPLAGADMTLEVNQWALSGANVLLLASADQGATPVPGGCSLLLDASTMVVLGTGTLDTWGSVAIPTVIPGGAPAGVVYLQALINHELGTWVSNGLSLTVE